MSSQLIIPRALDANGDSAPGAKAYVYQTGTSVPVTVYQNTGLTTPHANPIVADGAGYFDQAFYGGTTALRVVVTTSADVSLVTYDPVPIVSLTGAAASSVSFTPTTPIPQTNVQDAIVSVQNTLDTRVKPLENGARLVTSGGSSNAYTLTPTNAVSAYAAGQEYEFIANHANTGAATLNVSGLGGVAIQKYNASAAKVAMEEQDIAVGEVVRVKHDGTNFVWVSKPVGGPGMVFIQSQDASSDATLDFTGFDASRYDAYAFEIQSLIPANDNVSLLIRTSSDGGSTYNSGASDYSYVRQQINNNPVATASSGDPASSVMTVITGVGSDTGEDGVNLTARVLSAGLAKKTSVVWQGVAMGATTADHIHVAGAGSRLSSATVNAIRFYFSAGNIESGTITMYGLRNS